MMHPAAGGKFFLIHAFTTLLPLKRKRGIYLTHLPLILFKYFLVFLFRL